MARGLNTAAGAPVHDVASDVLADIDWSEPWFAPWRMWGEDVAAQVMRHHSVAHALNAARSSHGQDHDPVCFVPQAQLPAGEAYEAFIARTRHVPTRDGLHDFFNGLCWARFPLAKRRLNALQSQAILRDGVQATRGPVRDALTLFDENAVLLQVPDALWQALSQRNWQRVFVELREAWQQAHWVLFGHALLEKLVHPYKSITGHVWRVPAHVSMQDDAALDAWLVQDLRTDKLARKPFEPLPVLGIPGWHPDNAQAHFYDDVQVFRPRRT